MKNLKQLKFSLVITILFMSTFSSCNNDDDSSSSNVNNPNDVINIVNNGTWRITYYFDTDQEETNTFTGYNFTFGANSVLTTTNGTNTYTGIWSVTDSNSNDDSISDLHFNIAFASPTEFEELTDDWEITEKSATIIKLRDVSGGNGGTDYLTFTKN
ncbi:hypothetical protein [uncultured Flavobacterium sp.]|uniref:hypothetical protein n=1 Tax=uncultured Flavobacterium sp. TaxID=165435 RepID=UPI0030ED98E2|tara:strand:+ start:24711 stop:25181 length:471 start_codon:yes stop_codon:yes gene_type:complete